MLSIRRSLIHAFLTLPLFAQFPLLAQSAPGKGWSSFGVLPFVGYDPAIVKTSGGYVLYYTVIPPGGSENGTNPEGRAFSKDLKAWTIDTSDICATSGDLCIYGPGSPVGTLARFSEPIYLPDGRIRAVGNTMLVNGQVGFSMVSSDGVTWKQEPGYRFTPDQSSIFKVRQLGATSYAYLPDGTVRMYFVTQVVPGSPGTPSWYNNCMNCGITLSALSKDYGLTWVQDPGVRINPVVHGPMSGCCFFNNTNVASVTTTENGKTIYRIYSPATGDGIVSYISEDSLNFTLEGRIPAQENDPRAMVLPDGRIWFLIDPNGVLETLVFGPQTFTVSSVRADVGRSPTTGFSAPFQSATLSVTGTSTTPVSFSAVLGSGGVGVPFQPQYYSFSPPGGNPSLSTVVNYTGPSSYSDLQLTIHAQAGDTIAVGAIYCMMEALGKPGNSTFCQSTAPALPMNSLSFNLLAGSAPSSQVSDILMLGGSGYPFSVASSVPWATGTATSGIAPVPLTITVNPAGLAPGTYTGTITITAESVTELITVTVVITGTPSISGVTDAASGGATVAPNGFATIYGQGFASGPAVWSPTSALPTTLSGAKAKIGGEDAFISYASFGQLNILIPPDLPSGLSNLTVTTPAGNATATVNILPISPQWFTYSVGDATWVAGLIANTSTLIAPTGIFGANCCRAAKAGDYIEVFANGLGPTNPPAPAGTVLTTAYPVPDLSKVKVTIGGQDAAVVYAGLVGAGLYQLNVLVPSGLGLGDLPVVMTVNGIPAKAATLNFQ